ncbi:MAG: hypothetical protein IKZ34_00800 [Alphaproteobacteria bacterium]|nr:hypothetical protein [Alphaproteobacteria bacterium]
MRWCLEDVERAIRQARNKITPVADEIIEELKIPKNTDVFVVGGFVRDAVLCELTKQNSESKDIDLILSEKPDLSQNPNIVWKKENSFGGIKVKTKKFPEIDIFDKYLDWPGIIVGQYFDFNFNSIYYHNKTKSILAAAPFYGFTSNKKIELINYQVVDDGIKILYSDPSLVSRALKFKLLFQQKYKIDASLSDFILYLIYNMDKKTEQEMLKYTQQKIKDEILRRQIINEYYKIKCL